METIKEISSADIANRHPSVLYVSKICADTLIIDDAGHKLNNYIIRDIASNKNIKNIEIKNNYKYKSVDGIVYNKSMVELIACPAGKTGNIVIPEGIRTIESLAFNKCQMQSVKLPNSLVILRNRAFYNCKNLKYVDFGSGIKNIGDAMETEVFSSCAIQELVLPAQIKRIGAEAFLDNKIKKLVLPNGLEKIASNAFFGNTELTEVYIPDSVKYIGEYAFANVKKIHINKYVAGLANAITEARMYANISVGTVIVASTWNEESPDNIAQGSDYSSSINEERRIPDRPKVVRGLNAPVITSHVGLNPRSKSGNELERRVIKEAELILPKHLNNVEFAETIVKEFINEQVQPDATHLFACTTAERQETALQVYCQRHDNHSKNYLKRYAKDIIKRFAKEGRHADIVAFIKLDILSKRMLKEVLDIAADMPDVTAYILKQLEGSKNVDTLKL